MNPNADRQHGLGRRLLTLPGRVLRFVNPLRWLWRGVFMLRNRLRHRAKLDYILFTLSGEIPDLPEERGFIQSRLFGEPPLSLVELDRAFRQIASDGRPQGVVLILRNLALSLADLQTLRDSITRLRDQGKRVICYAQDYDLPAYYLASAADQVWLQPGGLLGVTGLRQEAIFLKDALAQVGIGFDAVAISPYKGAYDQLTRDTISPEGQAQLEWLLDSRFAILVDGIAAGRRLTPEAVRAMIDGGLYTDDVALAAGYVDAILNEEGFPAQLQVEYLVPWEQAERQLLRTWRKRERRYVALLEIRGTMIPGESQQPPSLPLPIPLPLVGEALVGDVTIVRQVRQLMQDDSAAAVLLYVDSPGGAAQAAEAMTSALDELAKTRPLVVYMNSVAASGGYYVATPAQWIVAQPGTITGSIGVLSGKPISAGLFDRLHINRQTFQRGANAGIFSDDAPFSDEQRQLMRGLIERLYQQFITRVAASRKLTLEQVDAVSGGRVWTGVQAKDHGLVDELGGLQTALNRARELANLPETVPLEIFQGQDKQDLPPQLAEVATPAAGWLPVQQRLRLIFNGKPQMLSTSFIEDWRLRG